MASNKENLVIILDVRETCDKNFRQKAINSCVDIIKRKICQERKDYLSFVLVGTKNVAGRSSEDKDNGIGFYSNIRPFDCLTGTIVSWQLLIDFYEFVDVKGSNVGNWLEALAVASSMLKVMKGKNRVANLRVILYYDFNDGVNKFDEFKEIMNDYVDNHIKLFVIAPNIEYWQEKDDSNRVVFASEFKGSKTKGRIANETYAVKLISHCSATLYNIDSSLSKISNLTITRPWTWNCQLKIGKSIAIDVSAIILSKYEKKIKLKKVWTKENEVLSRKFAYFIGEEEIAIDDDDVTTGYKFGGTPIAYDESMDDDNDFLKLSKGLMLVGFILRKQFCQEYISASMTYLLTHQQKSERSAKIINALVRVLVEKNRVALCWKIYSDRYKRVSYVILDPIEATETHPAAFYMYEIAMYAQYHYIQCPKLISRSTECTKEQYDAIDNLIDAMDLTTKNADSLKSPKQDLLPFSELQNVFEVNLMDTIERKVIAQSDQLQELLDEKHYREKFWKLPESIEEPAKEALNCIKEVFSLEVSMAWLKEAKDKAKQRKHVEISQYDDEDNELLSLDVLDFDHVRHCSPAADFENLLQHYVIPLKNITRRDVQFNKYGTQIRSVIWDLIFKDSNIDYKKVCTALEVYKKKSAIFNAFDDYNEWMEKVKKQVVQESLEQFWQDIIVKHELGLCFAGPITKVEEKLSQQFYNLNECSNN